MKVPYLDFNGGKITFPQDKQITPTEFDGYFNERESDVSGTGTDISDNPDSGATVTEAEQPADMHELRQREQVRELFRDLLNSLRLRGIPTEIWADEIENRLSVYEFWREV